MKTVLLEVVIFVLMLGSSASFDFREELASLFPVPPPEGGVIFLFSSQSTFEGGLSLVFGDVASLVFPGVGGAPFQTPLTS